MISIKKILVCCPGNAVTGGPELLHQLVETLCTLGHDATIAYYPFENRFECPIPYRHYRAPQSAISDNCSTMVILPEVATQLARKFQHAQIAIWWLSVDNYWGLRGESVIINAFRRMKAVLRGTRAPLWTLRLNRHFAQSQYAADFLARHNFQFEMLTDYLGKEHLVNRLRRGAPDNIVLYNPKKDKTGIERLMRSCRSIKFVPINNLRPSEVSDLLSHAKIYADFGPHPGKDRLPREAAIAGCCVVTGRRGSAANLRDVPIPETYKLDQKSPDFVERFSALAHAVFAGFETCTGDFESYRESIRREPEQFRRQVEAIFGTGAPDCTIIRKSLNEP